MNGRAERLDAREKVMQAALKVACIERTLHQDDGAVAALAVALTDLELAARDLVAVIDDQPLGEHPKGWQITPDVKP